MSESKFTSIVLLAPSPEVEYLDLRKRMTWWRRGGGVELIKKSLIRHFSRERAENVKRVNPKVPFPEAISISQSLYQIIKQHGPLSVSNTWIHAKVSSFIFHFRIHILTHFDVFVLIYLFTLHVISRIEYCLVLSNGTESCFALIRAKEFCFGWKTKSASLLSLKSDTRLN